VSGAVPSFRFLQQNIHLREKNIARPAERSRNANAFLKLEVKDLRFSMKMMFAAGSRNYDAACLNWNDRISRGSFGKLL
jgi:hypothetical protein